MSFNFEELEKVKVLIVDDHTLFAEGIVSLLSFEPRILVVGIAKNGMDGMSIMSETQPDVVLLDINLPDTYASNLIDEIKKAQPEAKIIMLTGQSLQSYDTQSLSNGVNGFLSKECTGQEMIQAILRVHDGEVYHSQGLEDFYQSENNSDNVNYPVKANKKPSGLLTIREIEIIELVSKGLHNKEIATAIEINIRTVESHVHNILSKLGVNTRLEAVLNWSCVGKEIG